MTVDDIRTAFEDGYKDGEEIDNSQFYRWINQVDQYIYNRLSKAEPERWIQTKSYTVSSGNLTQALPIVASDSYDFGNINSHKCGFYKLNDDGTYSHNRLPITSFASNDKGFYLSGSNVVFTPQDWNNSETYLLRYIPLRVALTASTDNIALTFQNDTWKDVYLQGLQVKYAIWNEYLDDETLAEARFTEQMDIILDEYDRYEETAELIDYSCGY